MALEVTLRPGEVLLLDGATLRLDSDRPCTLRVDGIPRPNCPLAVVDLWAGAVAGQTVPQHQATKAIH